MAYNNVTLVRILVERANWRLRIPNYPHKLPLLHTQTGHSVRRKLYSLYQSCAYSTTGSGRSFFFFRTVFILPSRSYTGLRAHASMLAIYLGKVLEDLRGRGTGPGRNQQLYLHWRTPH